MAAAKKKAGSNRTANPGGPKAGGENRPATEPKLAAVEPVKLGRKRVNPPEIADAKAEANARYKARKAGILPPVETAPLGQAYREGDSKDRGGWKFRFSDALVEVHEATAAATGIDAFRIKQSKADELEQCVLAIMSDKGVEIPQERRNMVGLVILLIAIYLPIVVAVLGAFAASRRPANRIAQQTPTRPQTHAPQPASEQAPQRVNAVPPAPGGFSGTSASGMFSGISAAPEHEINELEGGGAAFGALIVDGDE